MSLKGIDISVWQGDVDYSILPVDFIIFKTTEGVGFTDPKFLRNQQEARKKGLLIGYYHFARPDLNADATKEADWFLTVCKPLPGEVLFLDYEPPSCPISPVVWCKNWLDRVSSKLNNYKSLIYLNQSQVKGFGWKPIIDAGYGLWLAAYLPSCPATPWPVVAFQQDSSSGVVAGVSGKVDTDLFFGDKTAYKKYGVIGTTPPTNPLEDEIARLELELTEMRASRDKWKDEYGKAKDQLVVQGALIESLKIEIAKRDTRITELESQVSDALSKISKLDLIKAIFGVF